jgi:hypothetical protein
VACCPLAGSFVVGTSQALLSGRIAWVFLLCRLPSLCLADLVGRVDSYLVLASVELALGGRGASFAQCWLACSFASLSVAVVKRVAFGLARLAVAWDYLHGTGTLVATLAKFAIGSLV